MKASLPVDFTTDEYNSKDTELVVGLALSISFIFLELITFGTGLTMFSNLAGAYCKKSYFGHKFVTLTYKVLVII